ncbi:hypothetical protein F4781DRAFT_428511 [Annulohypoxylon bovei var. microspora]|nr:hypothetical protein F4781DRAFT_428511 [Annulohypoxylon bovei var. microspora]
MSSHDIFEDLPFEHQTKTIMLKPPETIRAAFIASPTLLKAFKSARLEDLYCRRVLTQRLGEELIPIAIAWYHSQTMPWTTLSPALLHGNTAAHTQQIVNFCQRYLVNAGGDFEIHLEMMENILQLNCKVLDIAHLLAAEADIAEPTPTEKLRISKCIYMYELATTVVPYAMYNGGHIDVVLENALDKVLKSSEPPKPFFPGLNDQNEGRLMTIQHWGLGQFHAIVQNVPASNNQSTTTCKSFTHDSQLLQYPSLFPTISRDPLIWYNMEQCTFRDLAEVSQAYPGLNHEGPCDIFLWSHIYRSLHAGSPLSNMAFNWEMVFVAAGVFGTFGCPQMGKFSFPDRRRLEALYPNRLPTYAALVEETISLHQDDPLQLFAKVDAD